MFGSFLSCWCVVSNSNSARFELKHRVRVRFHHINWLHPCFHLSLLLSVCHMSLSWAAHTEQRGWTGWSVRCSCIHTKFWGLCFYLCFRTDHLETITTLYFADSLLCLCEHHSLPLLHQPTPLFPSLSCRPGGRTSFEWCVYLQTETNESFKLYLSAADIKARSSLNKYQLYSLGNHLRGELRLLLRDGRAEGVALRDPVRLHRPDHKRMQTLWVTRW